MVAVCTVYARSVLYLVKLITLHIAIIYINYKCREMVGLRSKMNLVLFELSFRRQTVSSSIIFTTALERFGSKKHEDS